MHNNEVQEIINEMFGSKARAAKKAAEKASALIRRNKALKADKLKVAAKQKKIDDELSRQVKAGNPGRNITKSNLHKFTRGRSGVGINASNVVAHIKGLLAEMCGKKHTKKKAKKVKKLNEGANLFESVLTPSYGTAELMNDQFNKELASAYLYDIAGNYCERRNLLGFAKYYREAALEEREHAESFRKFLVDTGTPVNYKSIEVIEQTFTSVMDVAQKVLHHEEMITESINNLCKLAHDNGDKATKLFLQEFVTEQIDEELKSRNLIIKLEMIGGDGSGILALDQELLNSED